MSSDILYIGINGHVAPIDPVLGQEVALVA
jgi:hypothetical protein